MSRQHEPIAAHPNELQAWCCRSLPPVGKGFKAWCGYLFGLVVRIFTGPYGHVGIRLFDTIWEAVGEGVVARHISTWNVKGLVVEAIRIPATEEQDAAVVHYCNTHVGVKYDYAINVKIALSILGLPHGAIPDDLDATLNCSGLEAHAYAHAGISVAEMVRAGYPLWRFSPSDNWRLVKLGKAAYRGRVVFPSVTGA